MSILPYQQIKGRGLISPEVERGVSNGKSFGLSNCGYDIRIAKDVWLWPFFGRLAYSFEYFNMPNDLVARVCDKSSWARKFVFVQNTVIEPGWRGYLTLELTRQRPWPIKIKAGTPIAQILFETLSEPTEKPYDGKYQDQIAAAVPAIEEPTSVIEELMAHDDWPGKDSYNPMRPMSKATAVVLAVVFILGMVLTFY